MSRSVYVNGQWRDYRHARVHVEDRGFQFADGVYETFAVHHGVIIDVEAHLDRLTRSLSELQMDWPVARRVLPHLMFETRRRNYVGRGLVYVQVTRGQAKRDHLFPKAVKSSLIIIARHLPAAAMLQRQQGIEVITKPDERWRRCDIKSISLLANVLARQAAGEQGAQEAWLVNEQGIITEGSASNAWIVDREKLITHKSGTDILNGITRLAVMEIAQSLGLTVDETGFSRDQALEADEAFITSSVGGITPVVRLDGQPIGTKDGASGGQGAITQKIQAAFAAKIDQL